MTVDPKYAAMSDEEIFGDDPTAADRKYASTLATLADFDDAPAPVNATERKIARMIPPPSEPMKVARDLAGRHEQPLTYWRGDFYRHIGTRYEVLPRPFVRKWLYQETEAATWLKMDPKGQPQTMKWSPTPVKINAVLDVLGDGILLREGDEERWEAFRNGVVIGGELKPHDPARFNLNSLAFNYEPDATCPEFAKFVHDALSGDQDQMDTLQEWFGYVLSGRTDLHKIGVLVGPPRCGKGTINRLLRAMVGPENFAGPTIGRFDNQFALAGLIGKSLASFGDVRWNHNKVPSAVETMLTISGGDPISVPRKGIPDWEGQLGVRFMMISNDAPSFNDTSGAFAGRMVFIEFRKSYLGQEDPGLQDRLMEELPGIYNWAKVGEQRLRRTGRFTESASVAELRQEVQHGSSPILGWADDWCSLEDFSTSLDAVFPSYVQWLDDQHSSLSPNKGRFARDLRSALGHRGVRVERVMKNGHRTQMVHGLRVRAGAQISQVTAPDNVISLFDSA
jgi:putative DNA primase/helicase